jgi:hypothetical protein
MPNGLDPDWHLIDLRKKHLLSVGWRNGSAKLCVIQFHKDGFFVHFPFHPNTPGVVARCTLGAGQTQFSLADEGGVVSHKVKYSHHGDGTCLFSQDGKVRSIARTKLGMPLLDPVRQGHLFSLDVQGIEHFPQVSEAERCSDTIGRGFFEIATDAPPPMHISARWLKVDPATVAAMRNPVGGRLPTGEVRQMLALAPPVGSPLYGRIMLIDVQPRPALSPHEPFLFLFTGGFGPRLAVESAESSTLAMAYPALNTEGLPSFDFLP